jgi:hypothetical protein
MSRRTLTVVRILWVAGTLLLALTWNSDAWVVLIPLAAVGPILREVAPAPDLDERQRLLDYRASHYALIVAYLVLFVLFANSFLRLKHEAPEELWLVLLAPLVVRTAISLAQGFGARKMALVLGLVSGAAWFAFSTAEHPFSPESAIGLSVVAFTAVGIRWPRLGGALLVLVAVAFAVFVVPIGIRNTMGNWMVGGTLAIALVLPPLLASLGLIGAAVRSARQAQDEFAELRTSS